MAGCTEEYKNQIVKLQAELEKVQAELEESRNAYSECQKELTVIKQTDGYHFQKGVELMNDRLPDKAIKEFKAVLEKFPNSELIAAAKKNISVCEKMIKLDSDVNELLQARKFESAKYKLNLAKKYLPDKVFKFFEEKIEEAKADYQAKKGIKTNLESIFLDREWYDKKRVVVTGWFTPGYLGVHYLCPNSHAWFQSEGCVPLRFDNFDELWHKKHLQLKHHSRWVTVKGIYYEKHNEINVEEALAGF